MDILATLTTIREGIIKVISNYHNTSTKHRKDLSARIQHQQDIGWEHFCKGRSSKNLTSERSYQYQLQVNKYSFTGVG